jgi:hypothetical protein
MANQNEQSSTNLRLKVKSITLGSNATDNRRHNVTLINTKHQLSWPNWFWSNSIICGAIDTSTRYKNYLESKGPKPL